MITDKDQTEEYYEAELSRRLIGLIFKTQNSTGKGFAERVYQKVFENILNSENISFNKELYCDKVVDGKIVGSYRLDFLIENKIVVEFKVRDSVYQQDISQILYYLAFKNLRLGLLAHFTNNGVKIKRLIV
ncbi:MAG: GxxExxY protein [Candidatus Berkelbacteria bacterium]|nr:GxxExxY protein [Candidatus Berkelbacteria bacterium]